jgi:hypothetical protein
LAFNQLVPRSSRGRPTIFLKSLNLENNNLSAIHSLRVSLSFILNFIALQ